MNLFTFLGARDGDGLEDLDLMKKLKKIPPKELAVQTYKRLDKHMRECALTSKLTLAVLLFLASTKLAEIFHLPHAALAALFAQ